MVKSIIFIVITSIMLVNSNNNYINSSVKKYMIGMKEIHSCPL